MGRKKISSDPTAIIIHIDFKKILFIIKNLGNRSKNKDVISFAPINSMENSIHKVRQKIEFINYVLQLY